MATEKSGQSNLSLIFGIVSIATAFIAALTLGQTHVDFQTSDGTKDISSAISNYELNDASSTTVYNQMVTNGWVAKDLLETIGYQNASIIENQVATAKLLQGTNTLITYGLGMIAVTGVAILINIYTRKSNNSVLSGETETARPSNPANPGHGDKPTFSLQDLEVMLADYKENPSIWTSNALTQNQIMAWERKGKPNLERWIEAGMPPFVVWLGNLDGDPVRNFCYRCVKTVFGPPDTACPTCGEKTQHI